MGEDEQPDYSNRIDQAHPEELPSKQEREELLRRLIREELGEFPKKDQPKYESKDSGCGHGEITK